jgi:penicillin-binding protein 1C
MKIRALFRRVMTSLIGRILFFCTMLPLIFYLCFFYILIVHPIPESILEDYPESQRIYDCHNNLLRESVNEDGARARWIDYDKISPFVIEAIISVEDKRFYSHSGVDYQALGRAVKQLITNGKVISGASTITMQLSRILFNHSHSWYGKIFQIISAKRIDSAFDKKTVLLNYLNRATYGAGTVGIEAASQKYFGKPNKHLSLAEAAFLAGLLKAPTTLNPQTNFDDAKIRQLIVLKAMLNNERITRQNYEQACRENIRIEDKSPVLRAMHFTDFVLSQIKTTGDIYTTLDMNLQVDIEELVKDHVQSYTAGGLTNASVIVINNENGAILSMVGSSNYWDPKSGSVNGVISLRQPGSALKPFTYALAFENGKTPATIVADIETRYLSGDGDLFIPRNYSENLYGPVLMHDALGRSLNIPAIRTLNYVGIDCLLARLRMLGFQSLKDKAEHYGLGLTLGNGEVTLLELAQGYAMFARKGLICKAHFLPDSLPQESKRAFSEDICFLITNILSDEGLRIQAFGAANPLLFDFPIAVKTGTSTNWRDNWVIGYTNKYTLAVWAGDFEGGVMNRLSGSVGAGPLFHKIVELVINRGSSPDIPVKIQPTHDVEQIIVCPLSGMTPTENCPYSRSIYVLSESKSRPSCDVHRKIRIDKRNGLLASDKCPSRYVQEKVFDVLPQQYAEWQATHHSNKPPTQYSPLSPPDGITADALVITSPHDGEVYLIEPGYNYQTQTIQFMGEVDPFVPEVQWLVDGTKFTTSGWPYNATWRLRKGKHRIMMSSGNNKSDPVNIEVR